MLAVIGLEQVEYRLCIGEVVCLLVSGYHVGAEGHCAGAWFHMPRSDFITFMAYQRKNEIKNISDLITVCRRNGNAA